MYYNIPENDNIAITSNIWKVKPTQWTIKYITPEKFPHYLQLMYSMF